MQTSLQQLKDAPQHALQQLLAGNARYVHDASIHPDSRPSAAPQSPIAAILSCSDSRVPAELVFDQGVGKLFVVRAAGNTYDRLAYESIRFAVMRLNVTLILVMGHEQCGAVTAAVGVFPQAGVGPMLENIYPAIGLTRAQAGDPVANAVNANAILTAQRLAREADLDTKVREGELLVAPARYGLETGLVELLS
jgi:carbonic anhydrase